MMLKYLSGELMEEIHAQRDFVGSRIRRLKVYVEPVEVPKFSRGIALKILKKSAWRRSERSNSATFGTARSLPIGGCAGAC